MKRILPLRVQYIIASILSVFCGVCIKFFNYSYSRTGKFNGRDIPSTYHGSRALGEEQTGYLVILLLLSTCLFIFLRKYPLLKLLHLISFMVLFLFIYFFDAYDFNWLVTIPLTVFIWHIYLHIRNIGEIDLKFLRD